MTFSIIIPVYNAECYINQCLDSVLGQDFSDYEIICVNDGSTDNSLTILEDYSSKNPRIKVLSQKNTGTAAARNKALEQAKGDYILFLDSDDWYFDNALKIISDNITDEDFLCFNGQRFFEHLGFEEKDCIVSSSYDSGNDYYNQNALAARKLAFVCVVLRAYKRSFLMKNYLFFNEDNSFEDNIWVPQVCFFARKVKIIDESLYTYRIHEGSKMQDSSIKRKADIIKAANSLYDFFSDKKGFKKSIVFPIITHHYQMAFTNSLAKEDCYLSSIVDWKAYKTVSRTKLRHRIQYCAMRISPVLFRLINKI